MKILYLCNKKYYDTKMSRVRFHSIEAIGRHRDVTLKVDGPGYDDFNVHKSIQEFKPDLIVWYKPFEIKDYDKIKIPKCIRYNEMWDVGWTTSEITKSKSDIVICHHLNDMPKYKHITSAKLFNIPHCAEKMIFRDYNEPKNFDILLTGSLGTHYPLRVRLTNLMKNKLKNHFKCKVLTHPGYRITNWNDPHVLYGYARLLNQAKITLTCSSKHRYALGKYVEIPMCNSLLAADLPNERHEFFKSFMLVIDPSDSDKIIIDKLTYYIRNDKERETLISYGQQINTESYSQENYAEKFVEIMRNIV